MHWHLVPLPPGIPFDQQQTAALSLDRGYLDIPTADLTHLADRLGAGISTNLATGE